MSLRILDHSVVDGSPRMDAAPFLPLMRPLVYWMTWRIYCAICSSRL